jgi:hypothetical protein
MTACPLAVGRGNSLDDGFGTPNTSVLSICRSGCDVPSTRIPESRETDLGRLLPLTPIWDIPYWGKGEDQYMGKGSQHILVFIPYSFGYFQKPRRYVVPSSRIIVRHCPRPISYQLTVSPLDWRTSCQEAQSWGLNTPTRFREDIGDSVVAGRAG